MSNWDWSIFWPVCIFFLAVAAFGYLMFRLGEHIRRKYNQQVTVKCSHGCTAVVLHEDAKDSASVREKILAVYAKWYNNDVRCGQVYVHHSGREYLLLAIHNGLCEDKIKWPLMAVYCNVQMTAWYARPLWQFLEGSTLNREVDNDEMPPSLDLMAMASYAGNRERVESSLPQRGSMWYSDRSYGSINQREEILVDEVFNKDRSQPIVSYTVVGRPAESRAKPLYLFYKKYKPADQEKAA